MSDDDSPLATMFQLQRNTIRQTEDAIESALEMPADVSDTLYGGVDAQREVQEQFLHMTRQSIHTSLDAAESVTSGSATLDDLRDSVDETFDTLEDQQSEAFDTVDEFVDRFEELEAELEDQTDEAQERITEQAEELAERFEEQLDQLSDQFEEQAERFDELEERIEDVGNGDDEG